MGKISADTFRRIYLLYLLGQFSRGSYGSLRLQKVAYLAERQTPDVRPFEYKKWHHGEFSPQLEDVKDQLQSMGYIAAVPLDTSIVLEWEGKEFNLGGNRLYVRDRSQQDAYRAILAALSPELPTVARQVVTRYGYKPQRELLDICYEFPEFKDAEDGDTIFESTLPETLNIHLSDDECEDLEIALSPEFVVSMSRLAKALDETEIDWSKVRRVERQSVRRT